jgi:hypothetical protein
LDGPFPKLCPAVTFSHQDGRHSAVALLLKAALIQVSDYRLLGASGSDMSYGDHENKLLLMRWWWFLLCSRTKCLLIVDWWWFPGLNDRTAQHVPRAEPQNCPACYQGWTTELPSMFPGLNHRSTHHVPRAEPQSCPSCPQGWTLELSHMSPSPQSYPACPQWWT